MMFWYGGGWARWQVGLMWIAMIAFWALLIWAVWALVTGATRRQQPHMEEQAGGARRILDEWLARGDISPEEYQRLRDVLDAGSGHAQAGSRDNTGVPAGTGSAR